MKMKLLTSGILAWSFLFLLITPAHSAELSYSDSDGIIAREGQIDITRISVHRGGTELRVHAPNVSCRIYPISRRDAKTVRERLARDPAATLQCLGKFKISERSGELEVETASFSLGRKAPHVMTEPAMKKLATDL